MSEKTFVILILIGMSISFAAGIYMGLEQSLRNDCPEPCKLCPAGKIEITKIVNASCEHIDSYEEIAKQAVKLKELKEILNKTG